MDCKDKINLERSFAECPLACHGDEWVSFQAGYTYGKGDCPLFSGCKIELRRIKSGLDGFIRAYDILEDFA
jgi:hypothetical protein